VVSAVRTPVGRFGGGLAALSVAEIGGMVGREAILRSGLQAEDVEEVVVSNARQAGVGPNPGRQVVKTAGLSLRVTGSTINMACGSGLKAVQMAYYAIRAGVRNSVLVVGVEMMSRIPYILDRARWGYRLGNAELLDALHKDGFICALSNMHMGNTAENLGERYGITRQEADAYALLSHKKAVSAWDNGIFKDEVMPVEVTQKKGPNQVIDRDECPRSDTTPETLAKLPAVFRDGGQVTAGNASAISDGAAAMVLVSEELARARRLLPLAEVLAFSEAGVDPEYMGIGPVPSVRALIKDMGLGSIHDFDLIEINEAFAVQVLACKKELAWDEEVCNVWGGAIAIGHPIGMTGIRILGAVIHGLCRTGGRMGLATACINGGMGISCAVKRV